MIRGNINSIDQLDSTNLTFADIRIKYGTHQSVSEGAGRFKIRKSRTGYQTEIGDIQEDVWRQLAEIVVKQANEEDILNRLLEYVNALPWMKNETAANKRDEALELHMSRIFDRPGWISFIPFNESWRPEVIAAAEIVEVIPNCCQKPGRVTAQQIMNRGDGLTVPCPHCGRSVAFKRVTEEISDEQP